MRDQFFLTRLQISGKLYYLTCVLGFLLLHVAQLGNCRPASSSSAASAFLSAPSALATPIRQDTTEDGEDQLEDDEFPMFAHASHQQSWKSLEPFLNQQRQHFSENRLLWHRQAPYTIQREPEAMEESLSDLHTSPSRDLVAPLDTSFPSYPSYPSYPSSRIRYRKRDGYIPQMNSNSVLESLELLRQGILRELYERRQQMSNRQKTRAFQQLGKRWISGRTRYKRERKREK